MKTVLIVAGLLMTGASVYGIVDYNKKAESKEFADLYKEDPAPVETVVTNEVVAVPVAQEKEILKTESLTKMEKVKPAVKKTTSKKKAERKFRLKEFSRGKMK